MREETIIRTTSALEADLDDLRDALLEGLTQYEGQLRQQCQLLPSWLALDFAQIWPLFCFDEDSLAPDAALGPRAIAIAAGTLEGFVEDWLGLPHSPRQHSFSQDAALRQRYMHAKAELEGFLEGLMLESEHVAQQAKETLGRWRDDILAELEDSRIRDIETIEQLVSEGTLEIGRDARAEIALLWEEQRRRAGALLRAWEPFEALILQGLEISRDGIEELQSMVEFAHQGLSQAYPSIARLYNERAHEAIIPTSVHEDPFGGAQPARAPRSATDDLLLISTPKDSQTPAISAEDDFDPYGVAASADDDALPYAFDDRFDDTPISDETPPPFGFDDEDEDEPGPTLPPKEQSAPMISFSDEVEPSEAPDQEEPGHPTLFIAPGEHFGREEELDLEAKPTQPPRPSTLTKAHLPFMLDEQTPLPAPPTPADPPEVAQAALPKPEETTASAAASTVEDAEVETLLTITREELRRDEHLEEEEEEQTPSDQAQAHDEPEREDDAQQDDEDLEGDDDDEDAAASDDVLEAPKPSAKPLTPHVPGWHSAPQETTGQRVQEQLVVLSRLIFALSFALPLAMVVGTLVLAMASRHNPSLPNPLEPSPNMTHFIGIALLLWLIACPWVMRWQITWRGWRPMLWRYSRIHEEADILINQDHIELGHWLLRWDELGEVSLERWDDIHQGLQGWVLTLTTIDDEATIHRFSALATDEPTWARAAEPMTVHPEDAWRMSPRVFNKLVVASLGRSVGDDEH